MILKGDLKGFQENFETFFERIGYRLLWAGRMGRILPALGTNQIAGFVEYRPLTNWEKNNHEYWVLTFFLPQASTLGSLTKRFGGSKTIKLRTAHAQRSDQVKNKYDDGPTRWLGCFKECC